MGRDAVKTLADVVVHAAEAAARQKAVIALADVDERAATTALYEMFRRHGTDPNGMAGRLLTHFTGEAYPTITSLVAALPDADNFLGALAAQALAERGAAAFPAVHEALRSFPIPAEESVAWWRDETTKYRLMHSLCGMGANAAAATPTLMALLKDDTAYRDTRHQAKTALCAIGLPVTVEALAAELLRTADEDDENRYRLLDVLLEMPATALAGARGLGEALDAGRRHDDEPEQALPDLIARKLAKARTAESGPALPPSGAR